MIHSKSRKWLIFIAVVILIPALLYLGRIQVLTLAGELLVVRDKLERADIIFLLNGDATSRPYYAAKLYKEGWAPKIVIARMEDSVSVKLGAYPNPTDSNLEILRKLGVPESGIVQLRPEGGVAHTSDEALALVAYLKENPVHKMILVTSDFHSRRSRYTFQKFLKGSNVSLIIAPTADLKYGVNNWWRLEDGIIGVQNEYLKLLYYYYKY